jgi:hypothetical protein
MLGEVAIGWDHTIGSQLRGLGIALAEDTMPEHYCKRLSQFGRCWPNPMG